LKIFFVAKNGVLNLHRCKDIRSEYIINTIFGDSSPDIICLQEVTYEILDMILKKILDIIYGQK